MKPFLDIFDDEERFQDSAGPPPKNIKKTGTLMMKRVSG